MYLHIAMEDFKYLFQASLELLHSVLSAVWENWFEKTLQTNISQRWKYSKKEIQDSKIAFMSYVNVGYCAFITWDNT